MISRFARSFLSIILLMMVIATMLFLHPESRAYVEPSNWSDRTKLYQGAFGSNAKDVKGVEGGVIMPKLGNATAKAALGRATWKLLHTITLRYPEKPSEDEQDALKSWFHLTSRLYPCGECASEFQLLLKKYPPQTTSRRAASLWLCSLHNEVNKRLEKPEFDCAHIDSEYDCGCGDEPLGLPSTSDLNPARVEEGMIRGGR